MQEESVLQVFQSAARRLQLRVVPALAWSAEIGVPAVVGALRPIVLLPLQVATGLSPVQLESLLTHELVHLKRRDPWVNFLQLVMETVCFFNPAVWIISRNLRRQREFCCDDTVLRLGQITAVDYADALVAVAESSMNPRAVLVTVIGAAVQRRSELSLRIARIPGRSRPRRSVLPGHAFAALLVVVMLIGGILTTALQSPTDASSNGTAAEQSRMETERDRLLRLAMDPDAYVRQTAMKALNENPDESLVPLMIDLLQDSDSKMRSGAAYLLSQVADERSVEPLIKGLEAAGDHLEVTPLINALAATKDERAIDPIVAALKRHPDLAGHSIRTVANFDDDRIRDILFARISEDESPSFNLVYVLVEMNDRRLIPRMLQLLDVSDGNHRRAISVSTRSQIIAHNE